MMQFGKHVLDCYSDINTANMSLYRTDVLQLCQTALSNPFSSFQLEDTAMKVCLLQLSGSRHTFSQCKLAGCL